MDNEIPQNRDITYFAKTDFRSSNAVFGIKRKDRRQHMYVLGKSGTGKSVLLSNLIIQNIKNGDGVCVVDPHGELIEEIIDLIPEYRAKDVIYFNPADTEYHIGFNVLQIDNPKYKHLVASGLMGIFTKIWANAWSSRMEYILSNTILALLDTPNTTMLGIQRMLVDKDYRQMIINNLKDPVVKAFWVHEYEQWREQFRNEAIAPIQNKVGQFLSTSIIRNVVGQHTSTIDIFKIMNEGKIFLVNVSKGRIGEDNSALLGGMIITKIQLAAMERVRIPEDERKDFYLYVDEFQNFATDSFANILSEARKYRLCLIIAHQYIAQLESKDSGKVRDAVFGNVGTMIIFRVGGDDADFLEKEFEPEFTTQDLVSLPNFHIYIKLMIDGVTSRPFSATTLPPLKVEKDKGVKDKIIETSRRLYAKPRKEIEDEIYKWSGMLQTNEGEAKYKADCSNCKKITMVPFEPKEGRPVYCRDCMQKVKSGELKPQKGFISNHNNKEEKVSVEPLASLGIEFEDKKFYKNEKEIKYVKDNIENNSINNKTINNITHNNHNNHNNLNHKEKYHSPSPLLKDLLKKIVKGEKDVSGDEKIEVVEVKRQTEKPISLSQLKNNNQIKSEKWSDKSFPSKEASEEKKSLLKDALQKINNTNNVSKEEKKVEERKEDRVIVEIPVEKEKKEEVVVEIPIEEKPVIKESVIDPIVQEDIKQAPQKEENFIKKEEPVREEPAWQKPKVPKEVPEDVLRKILEQ